MTRSKSVPPSRTKAFSQALAAEQRRRQDRSPFTTLEAMFRWVIPTLHGAMAASLPRVACGVPGHWFDDVQRLVEAPDDDPMRGLMRKYFDMVAHGRPFEDICLGLVAEYGDKYLGQCFTPVDVAAALTQLLERREDSDAQTWARIDRRFRHEGDYFSMGDETGCGTGVLMLEALARAHARFSPFQPQCLQTYAVVLNDIDRQVATIAYGQTLTHSVLHGRPIGALLGFQRDAIAHPCVGEPDLYAIVDARFYRARQARRNPAPLCDTVPT